MDRQSAKMIPAICHEHCKGRNSPTIDAIREHSRRRLSSTRLEIDSKGANAMATVHAWFSAETALAHGSSIYRKLSGSTVNVTRTNPDKDGKGSFRPDEKYLGEVIRLEDGGCVRATHRVEGITR